MNEARGDRQDELVSVLGCRLANVATFCRQSHHLRDLLLADGRQVAVGRRLRTLALVLRAYGVHRNNLLLPQSCTCIERGWSR